ncbi:unnamed protein product [Lactuca saligna]|uniref:Uncharacterized protein n=1 Tax=Lactuca saligna TaxID=75948 RepID=A0AA35VND1_LACSI|nr:unnamed protein product [Lactuca saligna]
MDFIKDKPLSSCIKKLSMDDVGVVRIGENKHDPANDIDQGFNEFDEAANDFDLGLYQQILQSNSTVNMEVNEENVDDEVNEGEDNVVNMKFDEVANEFDLELYQHILQSNFAVNMEVNEHNVDNEVHEGEDNAVNMEVTKELNEMNKFIEFIEMNEINEENVDVEVHEIKENVEIRDFAVDDEIKDEDKTETNE